MIVQEWLTKKKKAALGDEFGTLLSHAPVDMHQRNADVAGMPLPEVQPVRHSSLRTVMAVRLVLASWSILRARAKHTLHSSAFILLSIRAGYVRAWSHRPVCVVDPYRWPWMEVLALFLMLDLFLTCFCFVCAV